ncbi:MAG: pyridoxal-phosphate dependent enzyme [Myxococcota bacterium]
MQTERAGRPQDAGSSRDCRHYRIRDPSTGQILVEPPDGFLLRGRSDALLQSVYRRDFVIRDHEDGLFRFRDWLPVRRTFSGAPGTVAWRAEALGRSMGLSRLAVAFTGWAPERGATAITGTFKELGAYALFAAVPHGETRPMVLASAGSSARAALEVASLHDLPVIVIVAKDARGQLWTTRPRGRRTLVVAVEGDYGTASTLAKALGDHPAVFPSGGVRNVARRDGLGTTLLAAFEQLGRVPEHYVQAVGSAAGALGAFAMSRRLLEAGLPGVPMRVHLVQNAPFAPIHGAWTAGLPSAVQAPLPPLYASVLANRRPPYAACGGVRDMLHTSRGSTWVATPAQARRAGARFLHHEGIALHPAAQVGLAGLQQAVRDGVVPPDADVLFNATGSDPTQPIPRARIPVTPDVLVDTLAQPSAVVDTILSHWETLP